MKVLPHLRSSRPAALAAAATLACGALLFVAIPAGAEPAAGAAPSALDHELDLRADHYSVFTTPDGSVTVDDTGALVAADGAAPSVFAPEGATPAVANGYSLLPLDSGLPIGQAANYTVRVVTDHGSWSQLLEPVKQGTIQLNASTGGHWSTGPTASSHVATPYTKTFTTTVSFASGPSCGSGAVGCTYTYYARSSGDTSWQITGANVWIDPNLLSAPSVLKDTILHELGHSAGLAHYDSDYLGTHQIMRSYVDIDSLGEYQIGDQLGLGQAAAIGFAHGTVIDLPCRITITDVRVTSPFCADINWMIDSGFGSGYDDGSFRPTATLTRQAAAAFLYRLEGEPPVPVDAPTFPDVPVGHPFRNAIRWMASAGLATGYADGTFGPNVTLTRQSAAAFFYRLEGQPAVAADAPTFPDVPVGHPFRNAIRWMAAAGITGGYSDGTFRPSASLTRQAMATFLHAYVT